MIPDSSSKQKAGIPSARKDEAPDIDIFALQMVKSNVPPRPRAAKISIVLIEILNCTFPAIRL